YILSSFLYFLENTDLKILILNLWYSILLLIYIYVSLSFLPYDKKNTFYNSKWLLWPVIVNLTTLIIYGFNVPYIENELKVNFILFALLFVCYISREKISSLNFNTSLITLLRILVIAILYKLILICVYELSGVTLVSSDKSFILTFLKGLIFPVIYEEILFRGFLLGTLSAFKLSKTKSNIIQSLIYGILHNIIFLEPSNIFLAIIYTCSHSLMGYLYGKAYLKSGSITCSIVLHSLCKAISFT
ncbi:CPBP family intramembrane glutamic endopeptidase, partial [Clostridium tarantellae]